MTRSPWFTSPFSCGSFQSPFVLCLPEILLTASLILPKLQIISLQPRPQPLTSLQCRQAKWADEHIRRQVRQAHTVFNMPSLGRKHANVATPLLQQLVTWPTSSGARETLPLAKAVGNHHEDGRNMMSVWDRKTGRHYIDTGADESVFPASPTDRQHCSTTQPLAAANDSRCSLEWLTFTTGLAGHLHPLHEACKGRGQAITWSDDCQVAFDTAKSALASAALLEHPTNGCKLAITVDASDFAVGGSLDQFRDGFWHPLAFFSNKLTTAERKYATFDRELLTLYLGIKQFCHYVEGRSFTAFTDHKSLVGAMTNAVDRSPRQTRHLSFGAEFTDDVQRVRSRQCGRRCPVQNPYHCCSALSGN